MTRGLTMIGTFPPPLGGAAKITESMRAEVVARGMTVRSIDTSAPTLSHARSRGYHTHRLRRNLRGLLSLAACPARAVYLVPDAGFGIWYSLVFALVAAARSDRLYLHHHSCRYIDEDVLATRLLTGLTRRRATHIFLTTGMATRYQRRYGLVTHGVIGNAWFTDEAAPSGASTSDEESDARGPTSVRIGHLSNLCAEKGFFDVAASFDAVVAAGLDAELRLAGPILQEAVSERLQQLQRDHGPRVVYLGPLYGESKRDYYRGLDVFVFPTRFKQEAAPNVLFEAAAAGVPSLSVDRACIAEILTTLEGGVCPPDDDFATFTVRYLRELGGPLAPGDRRRIRARFDQAREQAGSEIRSVLDAIGRSVGSDGARARRPRRAVGSH